MTHRSMQEIHMDSLARAAGVISQPHLPVSHARASTKPSKHRVKKATRWLLLRLSTLCKQTADWIEIETLSRSTAR